MTDACTVSGVLYDAGGDLLTETQLVFTRVTTLAALEGETAVAPIWTTGQRKTVTTNATTAAFSLDLMPGPWSVTYQGVTGQEVVSFTVPIAASADFAVLLGQTDTLTSTLVSDAIAARDAAEGYADAAAASAALADSEGNATAAQEAREGAETAEAGAVAAQTGAEGARDGAVAAAASIGVYADTTLAAALTTGLAAASEGETFHATGGDVDYIGVYKDVSGVATEQARFPKTSYLNDYTKETLGLTDTSVATSAWTAARSYAVNAPVTVDGFVRRVHIRSLAARPVRAFVANANGGNLELVRYVRFETSGAGAETITLTEDLPVEAGQYVGVYFEVGAPYYLASSAVGCLVVTGGMITEAGTAYSVNGGVTLGLGFDIEASDRREWSRTKDQVQEGRQNWQGETMVALGTSITQNQFYAEMAAQRLGADFVQFGTGGSTWSNNGSGDGRIRNRALLVDPRSPLVTIEGPINDFRLSEPLGAVRGSGAASTLGALHDMVQDLFEANPFRSVAVVLSPPNMDAGYAGKWNAANGNGVYWDEVMEAVRKQAEWLGLEVIIPKNMNGYTTKWHAADLIHPDETTGAIMLANEVTFRLAGMPKSRVAQCETPVVAFNTGTGQVTITCATSGATIRYTTDGSSPTTSSTAYSGAFTPSDGDVEIRAIATKSGLGRSPQRRARIAKNTTSGLGVGTWDLRPAVIGDITSTRGTVRSLEGGLNWSVDVEPASTLSSAIWLASGANNACEFEVAGIGAELIILAGIGASGWLGLGYARLGSIYTHLRYNLATGGVDGSGTFTALPMASAYEPTRRFRVARSGSSLLLFENVYGTWSQITDGLDLSALSGATGYYETEQLGILLPVANDHGRVKNVLVGTLT